MACVIVFIFCMFIYVRSWIFRNFINTARIQRIGLWPNYEVIMCLATSHLVSNMNRDKNKKRGNEKEREREKRKTEKQWSKSKLRPFLIYLHTLVMYWIEIWRRIEMLTLRWMDALFSPSKHWKRRKPSLYFEGSPVSEVYQNFDRGHHQKVRKNPKWNSNFI